MGDDATTANGPVDPGTRTQEGVARLLRLPPDLVRREAGRRDAVRLAAVRHPGLVPLVAVRPVADGLVLVHDDPPGSRPLGDAAALGARLATALAPVADGLAALHGGGGAHGRVGPATLLVTPRGAVVLTGTGIAAAAGDRAEPADDVLALGEVLARHLPSRGCPASLAHAVVRACDPDPDVRPSAADLAVELARDVGRGPDTEPVPVAEVVAVAVGDAARAERLDDVAWGPAADGPLWPRPAPAASRSRGVVGPAASPPAGPAGPRHAGRPTDRPAGHRRRATRRRRSAISSTVRRLGGPLLLVMLVLAGTGALRAAGRTMEATPSAPTPVPTVALPPSPERPDVTASPAAPASSAPPSVATPVAPVPDPAGWQQVVHDLDQARIRAFATPDEAALAEADLPGSPAWRRDSGAVRELVARGARVHGLVVEVVSVDPVRVSPDHAVLHVRDRRSAYDVVDVTGGVVSRSPASGERAWVVRLRATPAGWRTHSVTAA